MVLEYLKSKNSILLKTTDSVLKAYYIILYTCDKDLQWSANKINKENICLELDLTVAAVDKIVLALRDRELIIPLNKKGFYRINNKYFQN
jgi:hypothetical protein